MTTVVLGASYRMYDKPLKPSTRTVAQSTLYWACVGTSCVGWWDTQPPKLVLVAGKNRCPKFRAPDIFHDHTVGSSDEVIAAFCAARVLPARESFRLVEIPQEWIAAGLKRVAEVRVRRRVAKPDPEVDGLFDAAHVKPTPGVFTSAKQERASLV